MQPQLISGARCILSLNGATYGYGFVLDYQLGTPHYGIQVIDSPMKVELCPNGIDVSLSLKIYRDPGNDPVRAGISAPGDRAGDTVVHRNFTEFRYLTVELRDNVTDNTLLYVPQAVVVGRSGSVQAEDLLTENLQLMGIGFEALGQSQGIIPSIRSLF